MRATTERSTPQRGLLLVAAAAILWGTSGLTATVAYGHGIHPLTVSAWRMLIGAIALLPLVRRSPAATPLSTGERGRLALVCAGLGSYQACYFVAVQHAGVSVATLVTLGLAPVLVVGGERVRTRRPTAAATRVGVVLGLLGLAALVGVPADGAGGDVLTGAAYAAGSALGYAVLTLSGGPLSDRLGAQRLTAYAFVGAAVSLLPVTALSAGFGLGDDPLVLAAMLYLGLVPTALAYRLFFLGLQRVTATAAAILVLLEPVVATALAVPLVGERLTPLGWSGAALLLLAVGLVSRAPRSASPD